VLARLASAPRFAGSGAEQSARVLCEGRLRELGFDVSEEKFTYSQFPARFGPFICGSIFAAGVLLSGHVAAGHDMPWAGIAIVIAAAILSAATGKFLLGSTHSLTLMRRTASNLVASRRALPAPGVWLVAHTDSKSQTTGMLLRVGSVAITSVLTVVLIGTMVMQATGMPESVGFPDNVLRAQSAIASFLTAIAIVPVIFCFITNESPGALDNASGVAAVLGAAEELRAETNVGILLTSAEEIGLAGARAFVGARRDKGIALNCDTIDDAGRFICMTSKLQNRDAAAMAKAASSAGLDLTVRHLIRGILTDSIAFTSAGWTSCTLSRGNLGTLSRVHTSRDEPGRIDGTGIAQAARILAATVEELS
jgi:hypothetical protein